MHINQQASELLIKNQLISEIEVGLLDSNPYISPKFLYDPLGSHLFTAITLLPEYYPTITEQRILDENKSDIAHHVGQGGTLIDLGAGNCEKAKTLFSSIQPDYYVAIDFSTAYLEDSLTKLQAENPLIQMEAISMDFSKELTIPSTVPGKRTFFYPGSSLGNFLYDEALRLLGQIKSQVNGGGLLIGIDLMKSDDLLINAYDDPLKITSAFNLNILRSLNNILGSNFAVEKFRHVVKINHEENRVELYLQTLEELIISWPGNKRIFKKGDLIHTENSHKYTINSFQNLLYKSGFSTSTIWTDPNKYFAVIYAQ